MINKKIYYVKGMHCRSCEILIENKISQLKNIKNVKANINKNEVIIEYQNEKPDILELNNLFKQYGYEFFEESLANNQKSEDIYFILGIAFLAFGIWFFLSRLGLLDNFSLNSDSALLMFFVLGLVAGFSTCGSLVGAILLSLSSKWHNNPQNNNLRPHLMFNVGRLFSYGLFGALLGFLGNKISLSLNFASFLVILVSFIMIILALQMFNLKFLNKFKITTPKFFSKLALKSLNFENKYTPAIVGFLTFFLPCGFTLTAQGLALISGNPIRGFWIMFLFALGTLPALSMISLSSIKLFSNFELRNKFSKIAAVLILFFAFYSINNQLTVLGLTNVSDLLKFINSGKERNYFTPIVNGKQILKMEALTYGYKPNYFKVKTNIPVRWEIIDRGTSGCTNVIVARGLFYGQINLISGNTSIKEFTPTKPGKYKFSCWMGMISGIIEVVD